MDKARKDLAIIVGTSPYDAEKVKAGFDRIDAARSNVANVTSEAMIKGFGKMSDEQRQPAKKPESQFGFVGSENG
jgi:hypothetical protein